MTKTMMRGALALAGLAFLGGCASTRHSANVFESGFLSDYVRLEKKKDTGESSWADPEFRLADYTSVYVPPVELWVSEDAKEKLDAENAARIATLFRTQTIEKLEARGWTIADEASSTEPGARVAALRLALTEVDGTNSFGNFLTGLPSTPGTVIRLAAITADVHLFVGEVSTELQIVDASTGKVMFEALDRRVGAHSFKNLGATWGDVEDAIEVWSDRLAEGLSKK